MCGCTWKFTCPKCGVALKNDLQVSCGDQDPPTLQDQEYARQHELGSLETLRGLEAA